MLRNKQAEYEEGGPVQECVWIIYRVTRPCNELISSLRILSPHGTVSAGGSGNQSIALKKHFSTSCLNFG